MTTVVIAKHFEERHVERIRGVSDELRVLYRADLVAPPRWPGDPIGDANWRRPEEGNREFLAMLAEAEVLYDFPRGHVRDLLQVAPKLRWVQGSMAGAGEVAELAGLAEADVIVTTASGVFSGPLAEFALMAMLQHAKRLDRLHRDKAAKRWDQDSVETLRNKTLCLVGTGSIGRAVSDLARPFGMKILGVKRTVREDDEAWNYADELYPTSDLHDALREADYVVATLPLTPQTEHLLDADAIAATRSGAYFVNIGRGRVVDERALVEALGEGRLAGAALDVFEVEPLPEESPLWEMENVIISPHSTDVVPDLNELQANLFCENLKRYLAGEPLVNELDKKLGY